MDRVLGVAASGYYEWLQQPISNRAQDAGRVGRIYRTIQVYGMIMSVEREGFRTHSELGQGLAPSKGRNPAVHTLSLI